MTIFTINLGDAPISEPDNYEGYVFRHKGGRHADTRYWLCVADNSAGIHLFAINKLGEICGSASYGKHTFEDRKPVGRIVGALGNFEVEWFQ